MNIEPPIKIMNKIKFIDEHWVSTSKFNDEENLLLYEYNQAYADEHEKSDGILPYKVINRNGTSHLILYRGNLYTICYDQYLGDLRAHCTNLPAKYRLYPDSNYVTHGRYENINICTLDASDNKYIEGFITDRLHDYLNWYTQNNNRSKTFYKIFKCIYFINNDSKTFRIGDHYENIMPAAYSAFYKGKKYWFLETDNRIAVISNIKSFNDFISFSSYVKEHLK